MKTIKSLLIAICLVSVFCVISYGQTCSCQTYVIGGNDTKQLQSNYIPVGTNVHWSIWISTYNEMTYNYTFASATIIGGPTSPNLSYTNRGNYYQYSDSRNGVWNNCGVGYVLLMCSAQQGPRDGGGGASSGANVSW
jgi:hypothetical protein